MSRPPAPPAPRDARARSEASSSHTSTPPLIPALTTRSRGSRGRFVSSVPPALRRCSACGSTATSQWRTGTDGRSLCNKCGIRKNRKPRTSAQPRGRGKAGPKSERQTTPAASSLVPPPGPSGGTPLPTIAEILQTTAPPAAPAQAPRSRKNDVKLLLNPRNNG